VASIAGVKLHHSLNHSLRHPEFLPQRQSGHPAGHPKLLQLEKPLTGALSDSSQLDFGAF